MNKKNVVFGFLGVTLDQNYREDRWARWRPSVAICMQPDFLIDQFYVLHSKDDMRLWQQISSDIQQISPQTQVISQLFALNDPWDFAEVYAAMYDWCKKHPFDFEKYNYYLHLTTGTHVVQICWYLLVETGDINAQILQSAPTHKAQPAGRYQAIDLASARYDTLRTRLEQQQADNWQQLKSDIATRNAAFNQLIEAIEKVAVRSVAPILLMGPTGAGKSHLARQVYAIKCEKFHLTGRFVDVNCATLRGDGAMSALFGHVRGAFTGALDAREGLLKSAHKGVLFLDEIGELGLDEQAMLLKALEDKTFFPLGSDKEQSVDFHLIAGTNRDLRLEVLAGRFREDLFARLNIWTFDLPPLKQRAEDIEPNVGYELARFSEQNRRKVRFHREALHAYLAFAVSAEALWSGNFRDLSASVTRMATLAERSRITVDDVQLEIERLRQLWRAQQQPNNPTNALMDWIGVAQHAQLDEFDRVQLWAVLRVCLQCASLAEAGRRLFAQSRQYKATQNDSDRLAKYLKKYQLTWADVAAQQGKNRLLLAET